MDDYKTKTDHLQAVWFAAGVAVVIACLERAVVVSVFKQWHMWVFLALNLLLIAILFTSTHPPKNNSTPPKNDPNPPRIHSNESNPPQKSHTSQETEKKQPAPATADNESEESVTGGVNVMDLGMDEKEEGDFTDGDDEKESNLLSNDELNERVEAFISRFRQQYLVSDVKIRRSSSGNVCERAVFSKSITV